LEPTRLASVCSGWGFGKWQRQKIISDTQRDAFKKHAKLEILSIRHFWSKWPKLGSGLPNKRRTSKTPKSVPIRRQIGATKPIWIPLV
jgi:hypothetical protein